MMPAPWLTVLTLAVHAAAGTALLRWLSRLTAPDPRLSRIILWSYAARLALACALFAASAFRWPVLRDAQGAPGFWLFALDAPGYDVYGRLILDAWRDGTAAPHPGLDIPFFLVVAGIYRLFGPHALHAAFFNSWLGAASGLLAFAMARRLFGPRRALAAALVVSWWPSTLIWSSQVLKDPLSWFLILLVLWLATAPALSPVRLAALFAAVLAVTILRHYVGIALSAGALLLFVPAAISGLVSRHYARAAWHAGLVTVLVAGSLCGRVMNATVFAAPSHPEFGHMRRALSAWDRGDLFNAAQSLDAASRISPTHPAICVGQAIRRMMEDNPQGAIDQFDWCVDHCPDAVMRERLVALRRDGLALEPLRETVIASLDTVGPRGALVPAAPAQEASRDYVQRVGQEAAASAQQLHPDALRSLQHGYVEASRFETPGRLQSSAALLRSVPRALAAAFLAPFPWQWFGGWGADGIMRSWSAVEMLWIYALLPFMLAGAWHTLASRRLDGLLVLTVGLLLAGGISLVVVETSTLFRMRAQFLLPLALLAAGALPTNNGPRDR